MYISYTFYALCLLLLLWGGKFSGFGGKFHDDFMSLEVTKSLRGFAAIGVIAHHISQEKAFQVAGQLTLFENIGFVFVAAFFFCSGYGLLKNYRLKPNYLDGFLSKRILPVAAALTVSSVAYGIFYTLRGEEIPAAKWIAGVLGLVGMNEYAWFPVVIILLYLAFYLVFRFVRNEKVGIGLLLGFILLQGLIFCVVGHFAWWAGKENWWLEQFGFRKAAWWMQEKVFWFSGEWWVNSTITFFLGMVFAKYEDAVTTWLQKGYALKLIAAVILSVIFWRLSGAAQAVFGYWSEYSGNGPGIRDKLICYLAQLPQISMVTITVFMVMMKYHAQNPVSRFFGGLSLETYMMNLMAITVCRKLLYKNGKPTGMAVLSKHNINLVQYIAAVFVITIAAALIYRAVNRCILKLLAQKKTGKAGQQV